MTDQRPARRASAGFRARPWRDAHRSSQPPLEAVAARRFAGGGGGIRTFGPPAKVSSVFTPCTRSGPRTPAYTSAQELRVSARFVLLGEPFGGAGGPCGLGAP